MIIHNDMKIYFRHIMMPRMTIMSLCIITQEQIISLKRDWGYDFTIFILVILIYVYTQTYYQSPQEIYKISNIYNNIGDSSNKFISYFFQNLVIWVLNIYLTKM